MIKSPTAIQQGGGFVLEVRMAEQPKPEPQPQPAPDPKKPTETEIQAAIDIARRLRDKHQPT